MMKLMCIATLLVTGAACGGATKAKCRFRKFCPPRFRKFWPVHHRGVNRHAHIHTRPRGGRERYDRKLWIGNVRRAAYPQPG